MHLKLFLCQMPLLPQLSLFPGLWTTSEYAGLHTLRLGYQDMQEDDVKL